MGHTDHADVVCCTLRQQDNALTTPNYKRYLKVLHYCSLDYCYIPGIHQQQAGRGGYRCPPPPGSILEGNATITKFYGALGYYYGTFIIPWYLIPKVDTTVKLPQSKQFVPELYGAPKLPPQNMVYTLYVCFGFS